MVILSYLVNYALEGDDLAGRIISVKKKGSKDLIGVLVFLDRDQVLKLEDISSVVGSLDIAVGMAIDSMHEKIFGEGELGGVRMQIDEAYIGEIVSRIGEKIVDMISSMAPSGVVAQKHVAGERTIDMPEEIEVSESTEPEPDLDEALESIAVVEIDEEVLKAKEEETESE